MGTTGHLVRMAPAYVTPRRHVSETRSVKRTRELTWPEDHMEKIYLRLVDWNLLRESVCRCGATLSSSSIIFCLDHWLGIFPVFMSSLWEALDQLWCSRARKLFVSFDPRGNRRRELASTNKSTDLRAGLEYYPGPIDAREAKESGGRNPAGPRRTNARGWSVEGGRNLVFSAAHLSHQIAQSPESLTVKRSNIHPVAA